MNPILSISELELSAELITRLEVYFKNLAAAPGSFPAALIVVATTDAQKRSDILYALLKSYRDIYGSFDEFGASGVGATLENTVTHDLSAYPDFKQRTFEPNATDEERVAAMRLPKRMDAAYVLVDDVKTSDEYLSMEQCSLTGTLTFIGIDVSSYADWLAEKGISSIATPQIIITPESVSESKVL